MFGVYVALDECRTFVPPGHLLPGKYVIITVT